MGIQTEAEVKMDGVLPLFHHTLISTEFYQLMFEAAASLQLKYNRLDDKWRPNTLARSDDRLVVSPYNAPSHLLDLKRYDHATQLFAKALTIMTPVREDYAVADYLESFNFDTIFAFLKHLAQTEGYTWTKRDFYVVTFRSQLIPDADLLRLFDLDAYSHAEATASGGLLKYWYGAKDKNFRNMATCTQDPHTTLPSIVIMLISHRFLAQ